MQELQIYYASIIHIVSVVIIKGNQSTYTYIDNARIECWIKDQFETKQLETAGTSEMIEIRK